MYESTTDASICLPGLVFLRLISADLLLINFHSFWSAVGYVVEGVGVAYLSCRIFLTGVSIFQSNCRLLVSVGEGVDFGSGCGLWV